MVSFKVGDIWLEENKLQLDNVAVLTSWSHNENPDPMKSIREGAFIIGLES